MEKRLESIQKFANATVVTAAISHIFCCMLPTTLSILSIGSVLGLSTTTTLHDLAWFETFEHYFIIFSGVVLFIGGLAQLISWRIQCNKNVCQHPPCEPRKNWSMRLFIFASVLFIFNLGIDHFLNH